MKKFYTTLLMVMICAISFAQVTLTSSNYYIPGQTINDLYSVINSTEDSVQLNLNTPLVFGEELGTEFPNNTTSTTIYYSPEDNSNYPTETVSLTDENGMKMHIAVNENNATCLGISDILSDIGMNINIVFEQPMVINEFPAEYQSQATSTAHGVYPDNISVLEPTIIALAEAIMPDDPTVGSGFMAELAAAYDSIKVEVDVEYNNNFDETNTLTLSGVNMLQGEYEYLREYRQYTYTINMLLRSTSTGEYSDINECIVPIINIPFSEVFTLMPELGLNFPMIQTNTQLNYWIANDNYPIVQINTNNDATYAKSISVRHRDNNNVNINTNEINACIFPNPTTDYLNIAIENTENGKIEIYSANGSLVKEVSLNGDFNTVNVSSLSNGNYFYQISCGETKINGKFAKN